MFHFSARRRTSRFSSQLRRPFSSSACRKCSVLQQKLVHQELVLLLPDHEQIPQGVIEDHQHVRLVVQRSQNLGKAVVAGLAP